MDEYTLQQLGFRKRGKKSDYILRIGSQDISCFEAKETIEKDFFIMNNKKYVFFYKKIINPINLLDTAYEIGKKIAKDNIISDIETNYGN